MRLAELADDSERGPLGPPGAPLQQLQQRQQDEQEHVDKMGTAESSSPEARKRQLNPMPDEDYLIGNLKINRRQSTNENLTRLKPTNCRMRRQRAPQGAFFHDCTQLVPVAISRSLFVSLALCMFVVDVSKTTTATTTTIAPETITISDHHRNRLGSRNHNSIQFHLQDDTTSSRHGFPLGGTYRAAIQEQHHQQHQNHHDRRFKHNNNRLQQNQLKYLIARTSTVPHLIGRGHFEQQLHLYKQYQQQQQQKHRINHKENNLVEDNIIDRSLPLSVLPTRSQSPETVSTITNGHLRTGTSNNRRRNHYNHVLSTNNLRKSHLGFTDPLFDDVDSFDVDGLADFDDGISNSRDVFVEDDDEDDEEEDSDEDEDDLADEDTENDDEGVDGGGSSDSKDEDINAAFSDDNVEQNTITLDELNQNKNRLKGFSRNSLHSRPETTTESKPLMVVGDTLDLPGNNDQQPNLDNDSWNRSSNQIQGEPMRRLTSWGRSHYYDEVTSRSSSAMVTTASPLEQLEDLPKLRQQQPQEHHLRKLKLQPPAPYQSPVVVSISDNSFVSASPVNLDMSSSVNDVDGIESPTRPVEASSVHYAHIVAGPRNELPIYNRRNWHDSHIASIHMVQEQPNDYDRGNIDSAIIAILFGIGVTGTLIMIVSIKMRSIRERVAYKGRRRSLVPDTDFLINTIPM